MPTPAPRTPQRRLTPIAQLPVDDILIAACRLPTGWMVAACGPHESIILEQVPKQRAALLLALAFEQVRPLAEARIRTITPEWSDPAATEALHPVVVSSADRRVDILTRLLPLGDIPRPLAPTHDEPLLVACDASRGRRHSPVAGIACITEDGAFASTPVTQPGPITRLELQALQLAIDKFGHRRLHLTSDSMWAVGVANGSIEPTSATDARLARDVRRLMRRRGHVVAWVKGHADDALNDVADRLAVTTRRAAEFGLGRAPATSDLLHRIAAEAIDAPVR